MTIRTTRKHTSNPSRKQRKAAENVIVMLSLSSNRADVKRMDTITKMTTAKLLKRFYPNGWIKSAGVQCFLSTKH